MTTAIEHPADKDDMARATLRGRILLACAFIFALALVATFRFHTLPLLQSVVATSSSATAIATIKLALAGIAVTGTLVASAWILYARTILHSRQDPPPGAWLWRDTKIIRGAHAVRRGWISIGAAILTALLCIGFAFYVVVMLDRIAARAKVPSNVTIVQQKILPAK